MSFTVSETGGDHLRARFESMPARLRNEVKEQRNAFLFGLQARVQQKLSGEVLNVRTGQLRASINGKPIDTADEIGGTVGTGVKYARILEQGGVTPPHVIEPKRAQALAFALNGKLVFAKRVNHPGSRFPKRSYLVSSLTEMTPEWIERMRQAVENAAP